MSARDGFEIALTRYFQCQYCGQEMDLETRWSSAPEHILAGVLRCCCQRIPIVGGVAIGRREVAGPFLRIYDESESPAVAEARADEYMANHLQIPAVLRRGEGAFVEAVDALLPSLPKGAREWPIHSQHWYRTTKYLALLPLLEVLARTGPQRILDLGCGAGQFAFLAASYSNSDTVFALDFELWHLLAARAWILEALPHVCLLCVDANERLPLRSGTFDAVISSDALHYIDNKTRAVAELGRVRGVGGVTVLSHLHNSLRAGVEIHQGRSLEPGSWRLLFDQALGSDYLMVSDDVLRRAAASDAPSDHLEDGKLKDLAKARSLSVLGGVGPLQVSWPESVLRARSADQDVINPIYDLDGGGGDGESGAGRAVVRLRRRRLSRSFEYEFTSAAPPEATTLDVLRAMEDPEYRERQRRRGVLVIAPRRYATTARVADLCSQRLRGER